MSPPSVLVRDPHLWRRIRARIWLFVGGSLASFLEGDRLPLFRRWRVRFPVRSSSLSRDPCGDTARGSSPVGVTTVAPRFRFGVRLLTRASPVRRFLRRQEVDETARRARRAPSGVRADEPAPRDWRAFTCSHDGLRRRRKRRARATKRKQRVQSRRFRVGDAPADTVLRECLLRRTIVLIRLLSEHTTEQSATERA